MSAYVYGVVSASAVLPSGLVGVLGEPVETVAVGELGALVSPIAEPERIASPAAMLAHTDTLDRVAAQVPVLPMAFGTIVPDADAIVTELIEPMRAELVEGLRRIDGATQFTVRARFVQAAILAELLSENSEIAQLREATIGMSDDEGRFERIRLGELVVKGLQEKAEEDAARILGPLSELARETAVRETGRADDVVEIAALVDRDVDGQFEQTVESLAATSAGRLEFRLLGPQAPYDFARAG